MLKETGHGDVENAARFLHLHTPDDDYELQHNKALHWVLDDIRSKIEAAQSAALPSSALSKACQYALALWKKLTASWSIPN